MGRGRKGMFALLALGILLPGAALAVFGFRSLRQDRLFAERQTRDTLEAAAGLAAREIGREIEHWPDWNEPDAAVVEFTPSGDVRAARGLLWLPESRLPPPAPLGALAAKAEEAEIRNNDPAAARKLYEAALATAPPAARPGLLLRVARTAQRQGDTQRAARAWRQILALPDSMATPAALLALGDAAGLYHALVDGRFPLTRERYWFYSERARELLGERGVPREQRRAMLAEAADAFFTSARRLPAPGFVAFWRTDRAVIVAEESLQRRLTKAAETGIEPALQLRPRGYAPAALSALRPLADPELPWIVEAAPRDPAALERSLRNREMLYLAALALVLTALASGVYLTARAVRREMETARLQSDFVATVSHEFRSPLTGIRQLAELLDAGVVTDEARRREYFGLILNESGRLSRLVENILDFSRLEAGRKQYRMESIDTSAWLKDIAAALRNPRLTLDVPDGLPPAYGDRDALISVVANLLDNAFKYSPPEQPVTLRAGSANGAVTVSVTDRGPGIPPQEQQRVFDRFYRGAGELAENVKGAGIGLSLVKRIIEDHGGSVALDSRPGEGSTFTISLKSGALG